MTSLAAVFLYWSVRACERRASTLSRCHQRLIELYVRRSSASVTGFCASISHAVTASHDSVTFKKLKNVWFFNLCCFACDKIKLKNVKLKLFTKLAPGD